MNVVHLYDGHEKVYGGRGSVPGVVWNIARETAAAGHSVRVIERQWAGLGSTATHEGVQFDRLSVPTGADEPWQRVPYEMVDQPRSLARLIGDRTAFAAAAFRRLREVPVDVLHVHLPFAANVLATVAPWLRRKMVYTAHLGELRLNAISDGSGEPTDNESTETERTDNGLDVPPILQHLSPDIYLARRVAATTALNPTIAEQLVDRGVDDSSVRVVPNGVDVEQFRDVSEKAMRRVREAYGLSDRPVVLFVGTVMPRKGVIELIKAMASVIAETPKDETEPLLVIAGELTLDESYTARVETTVTDCGLEKNVELVGFVADDELAALYALSTVLALPSFEEGFGMTAVEALAAGTPVVGTSVGSVPEIVEDGCGVVVEPGDVEALAGGLREMIAEPPPVDRLQNRADSYAWQRVAGQVIETYIDVTHADPSNTHQL